MGGINQVLMRIAEIKANYTFQIPQSGCARQVPQQAELKRTTGFAEILDTANRQQQQDVDYFLELADRIAPTFGVDAALVKAVIRAESNFNSQAVSRAGAQGLMQLMPQTAQGLGVKDAFDPVDNITGGTKYLRQLLDLFGGNTELTIAAYNAGPGRVKQYNGVPPYVETKQYLKNVMNYYLQYKA